VKKQISDLDAHLGYWMRLVSNQVSQAFARKLESQDVTVAEWVVLRNMFESDDPLVPSAVAESTGLTRGAISKLIERLLQKGLVARRESEIDRRYQSIKLTARARALVPKLAKLADENDAEFFNGLTLAERKMLKGLLQKIAQTRDITTVPID
jgi:DNA-binding MarR family transcriptional regulator